MPFFSYALKEKIFPSTSMMYIVRLLSSVEHVKKFVADIVTLLRKTPNRKVAKSLRTKRIPSKAAETLKSEYRVNLGLGYNLQNH